MKRKAIIFGIIIFILLVINMLLGLTTKKETKETPSTQTPSPIETRNPYDQKKTDQLINIVQTRPTLVPNDAIIRQRLIVSLPKNTTVLRKTNNYTISYLSSPNVFQVEVNNLDIATVKAEVVTWFKAQGFSNEGICKLPVQFYLGISILQQAKESRLKVNPLPEGC